GLRMIARLHAVAGQAQHVADAHGGAPEDVTLDGDAVPVAAGNLHDRRVTNTRQQRTHSDAGHVAVGAGAVGGVDGIDVPVEDARALVDVFRVGRIRGRELRCDGERAGTQHALEPPRGRVTRQDGQRIAWYRF